MQTTLAKIRHLINKANKLSDTKKQKILEQVDTLDQELVELAKERELDAKKLADYTHLKAQEALGEEAGDPPSDEENQGLHAAIEDFEVSHPRLYKTIQTIVISLSSLGV